MSGWCWESWGGKGAHLQFARKVKMTRIAEMRRVVMPSLEPPLREGASCQMSRGVQSLQRLCDTPPSKCVARMRAPQRALHHQSAISATKLLHL